ncbi:uncharacterized protein FIBRA_03850 [Fibroporia radiculosa]|uniref:F-box domain-containing protein n=1 Tax=Fibroporia radiculosa TaxID=599839 RepID=J4G6F5_9APHY|nr:uncharacterized protein FIBRA_03850 [Fibroporia radiculosa]CCM01783.1 predicted protein [Fibroporia radiculosa]
MPLLRRKRSSANVAISQPTVPKSTHKHTRSLSTSSTAPQLPPLSAISHSARLAPTPSTSTSEASVPPLYARFATMHRGASQDELGPTLGSNAGTGGERLGRSTSASVREKEKRREREREEERRREKEKEKERAREQEEERRRENEKERAREERRERRREREREREPTRTKEKDKERLRETDAERAIRKEREREERRARKKEREHEIELEAERERKREKAREEEQERETERARRHRDRERKVSTSISSSVGATDPDARRTRRPSHSRAGPPLSPSATARYAYADVEARITEAHTRTRTSSSSSQRAGGTAGTFALPTPPSSSASSSVQAMSTPGSTLMSSPVSTQTMSPSSSAQMMSPSSLRLQPTEVTLPPVPAHVMSPLVGAENVRGLDDVGETLSKMSSPPPPPPFAETLAQVLLSPPAPHTLPLSPPPRPVPALAQPADSPSRSSHVKTQDQPVEQADISTRQSPVKTQELPFLPVDVDPRSKPQPPLPPPSPSPPEQSNHEQTSQLKSETQPPAGVHAALASSTSQGKPRRKYSLLAAFGPLPSFGRTGKGQGQESGDEGDREEKAQTSKLQHTKSDPYAQRAAASSSRLREPVRAATSLAHPQQALYHQQTQKQSKSTSRPAPVPGFPNSLSQATSTRPGPSPQVIATSPRSVHRKLPPSAASISTSTQPHTASSSFSSGSSAQRSRSHLPPSSTTSHSVPSTQPAAPSRVIRNSNADVTYPNEADVARHFDTHVDGKNMAKPIAAAYPYAYQYPHEQALPPLTTSGSVSRYPVHLHPQYQERYGQQQQHHQHRQLHQNFQDVGPILGKPRIFAALATDELDMGMGGQGGREDAVLPPGVYQEPALVKGRPLIFKAMSDPDAHPIQAITAQEIAVDDAPYMTYYSRELAETCAPEKTTPDESKIYEPEVAARIAETEEDHDPTNDVNNTHEAEDREDDSEGAPRDFENTYGYPTPRSPSPVLESDAEQETRGRGDAGLFVHRESSGSGSGHGQGRRQSHSLPPPTLSEHEHGRERSASPHHDTDEDAMRDPKRHRRPRKLSKPRRGHSQDTRGHARSESVDSQKEVGPLGSPIQLRMAPSGSSVDSERTTGARGLGAALGGIVGFGVKALTEKQVERLGARAGSSTERSKDGSASAGTGASASVGAEVREGADMREGSQREKKPAKLRKEKERRGEKNVEEWEQIEREDAMIPEADSRRRHPPTPVSPEEYARARSMRRGMRLGKLSFGAGHDASIEMIPPKPSGPYPFVRHLMTPPLLAGLLAHLTFAEWCAVSRVSKAARETVDRERELRECVLERFLCTVGYVRWIWGEKEGDLVKQEKDKERGRSAVKSKSEKEPLVLSLGDLHAYMRSVSIPSHQFANFATSYLQAKGDIDQQMTVQDLARACRAFTRVVLRLRAQAEIQAKYAPPPPENPAGSPRLMSPVTSRSPSINHYRGMSRSSSRAPSPSSSFSHSHSPSYSQSVSAHVQAQFSPRTRSSRGRESVAPGGFHSPLFRLRRAPLLQVFVPSPEGEWLSDESVLACENELRGAGVMHLLRAGDVVWDVAAGDEANTGRMVWDGSYLLDLDYTWSRTGDLPYYLPTLAFPPSYFHRVIRTPGSGNPICHIDISPWGGEVAANLQLIQDRTKTETPQGSHHTVVRWVHRSSFSVRPSAPDKPIIIAVPSSIPLGPQPGGTWYVDRGWYGTVIVEAEGTNEGLADLQARCGRAFPPRAVGANPRPSTGGKDKTPGGSMVFRILREKR